MPRPRSTPFPYTTLFRSGLPTDAIFNIASMTKPVTSVAIMMLAEQGKLKIDDPRSEERFSRNAETEIYTLSLHDALPIWTPDRRHLQHRLDDQAGDVGGDHDAGRAGQAEDRRSEIGRAVQQECRDRDLHPFPTRRSSDLDSRPTPSSTSPR